MAEENKKEEIIPENKEEQKSISLEKNKEARISIPFVNKSNKEGKKKEGSFLPMIFVTIASLIIAFYWDKIPMIKDSVHFVLNPSAGVLLNWNLEIGMIVIVFIITLITTLVQKYTTDQKLSKNLKKNKKYFREK